MASNELAKRGLGRKLAIVAMAATFGMGLTACGDDKESNTETTNNDNSNGGSVDTVTAPKGTVTGQIVDTNGNPIANATVYIADGSLSAANAGLVATSKVMAKASVVTDVAGQFSIPDVVAQSVVNAGGSTTADSYNLPIQLFVDTPDGYLDVTIQVKPQAQVLNDQPGTISGGQTNAPLIFVDGFVASTGTVKVPALTSKVVGKLRDASTGAPLVGQTLTMDFNGISNDQTPSNTAAPVTYATSLLVTQTVDDGSFEFLSVPDDSYFTLRAGNVYQNGALFSYSVSTQNEGANTTYIPDDDLLVTPSTSADDIHPYVAKVDEVVGNGGVGQLASSFTNTFTIRFSEALSASSAAVVKVTVANSLGGTEQIVSATASLAGNVLTVQTASPIEAGKIVKVYISSEQIADLAGNTLVVASPVNDLVSFDSVAARDVVLTMETFTPPVTGLQPVSNLTQITAAENASSRYYLSSDALVDTIPDSVDEDDGDAIEISQLNAPEALGQLATLIDLLEDGSYSAPGHADDVNVGTARAAFSTSGAARYAFVLDNGDGSFDVPAMTVLSPASVSYSGSVQLDGSVGGGNYYPTLKPASSGATDIQIAVTNASAGQVLKVVSVGDISGSPVVSEGAIATLPLIDHVAPTTTGQTLLLAAAAAVANDGTSSGGNLVLNGTTAAPGKLIYPVTPQLYDIADTTSGFSGDTLSGAGELEGLSSSAAGFTSNGVTEYDATGASAFLGSVKGRISINVTESLADNPPLLTASGASTVFSAPGQLANILAEDGTGPFYVYTVDIDSTEKLQADARAELTLDLTGIADVAGNVSTAATGAAVELRDFMPPVMTKAFFDGTNWVFQFNEPVKLNVGEIVLQQAGAIISLQSANDGNVPAALRSYFFVDGSNVTHQEIIVIPVANPAVAGINAANAFGGAAYTEAAYESVASLTVGGKSLTALPQANLAAQPKHGLISYESVQDRSDNSDIGGVNGNSWVNWMANPGTLGIPAPVFYGANILGPFTESLRGATLFTSGRVMAANNNTFSVDLDFTHAIDLSGADVNTDGKLSDAEVRDYVAARLGVYVNNTGATDPNIAVSSADVGSFVNGNFVPAAIPGDSSFRYPKQGNALRVTFTGVVGEVIESTNRISILPGGSFVSAIEPNLFVGADDLDATLKEVSTAGTTTTTEFAPIAPNDAGTGVEKAF